MSREQGNTTTTSPVAGPYDAQGNLALFGFYSPPFSGNGGVGSIEVQLGDGVNAITSDEPYQDIGFRYACILTGWKILANQAGSIQIDLQRCDYTNYDGGSTHPGSGDSIVASAPPHLSSAVKAEDATLVGWQVDMSAGDVLRVVVDSASTVQRATLILEFQGTG